MATVGVDDGSLQADHRPSRLACSEGWRPLGLVMMITLYTLVVL